LNKREIRFWKASVKLWKNSGIPCERMDFLHATKDSTLGFHQAGLNLFGYLDQKSDSFTRKMRKKHL